MEEQNAHITACERFINLSAVYMPNKVLLADGNSSKISSGGREGESDEEEKTQMQIQSDFHPLV